MQITGTNRNDRLVGTSDGDTISGGRGKDWIEGDAGNDILTGGAGADTFVLRAGDGHDVVMDFNRSEGDRLLFDIGRAYSDRLPPMGALRDGQSFQNFIGTATFDVSAIDYDGDGVTDTQITATGPDGTVDSLIVLGVPPSGIFSGDIIGG